MDDTQRVNGARKPRAIRHLNAARVLLIAGMVLAVVATGFAPPGEHQPISSAASETPLSLPLLVDGQRGRLYGLATAWSASGASSQIAVFAARDGKFVSTEDKHGRF